MATSPSTLLAGITSKQKAEAGNFERFVLARPDFAERPLVGIQWGSDPPDVLCLDQHGNRIGVELVQWLNESQMAASKARHKREDSYRLAIRSSYEQPPANIGFVFISTRDEAILKPVNAQVFRKELYDFVARVDTDWLMNPGGMTHRDTRLRTSPAIRLWLYTSRAWTSTPEVAVSIHSLAQIG
jgi:hypothetical protein